MVSWERRIVSWRVALESLIKDSISESDSKAIGGLIFNLVEAISWDFLFYRIFDPKTLNP
jgi:hypothetical protein